MSRMEVIQQSPLTDDLISVHEIIGYVLITCKELDMAMYHGEHLAAQTVSQILKISTKQAESAYYNASGLSKKKGWGVGELLKWNKAKSHMNGPVAEAILKKIAKDERLDKYVISEIQAAGYLSLAALELNFLSGQLTPLEMEFNYQLRTLVKNEACAIGLHFLESDKI
ncbi:hypothetical protein BSK59_05525 [Paenibacillus odorifer]|uniref:hypothetical protein n=1 Tax=Paenibacillus odorifer TaxID=189426 RepID=UPI00096DF423|nr:hypothetical protein [Paenibacillus odorifer]OME60878.1 hypothetical protein BSK59_05525 [Paenibacillus odorifer]